MTAVRYLEWEAAITGASSVCWNSSFAHALMGPIQLENGPICSPKGAPFTFTSAPRSRVDVRADASLV